MLQSLTVMTFTSFLQRMAIPDLLSDLCGNLLAPPMIGYMSFMVLGGISSE